MEESQEEEVEEKHNSVEMINTSSKPGAKKKKPSNFEPVSPKNLRSSSKSKFKKNEK